MSLVGKCPYCDDGMVMMEKKQVSGKNAKVYTCSNASWYSEDGEVFELKKEATCSFRIWGNSLMRWGKRGIGIFEVKKLLRGEDVDVRLFSYTAKKEYFKYITLDKQYGVSVLWDMEVEEPSAS
jgi:hypothetical protein